uniref:Uncharacterized protein n=1 Tax=Romanomermis culicivorax TaxID=13658 RepID=A0A915K0E1_ROMCU
MLPAQRENLLTLKDMAKFPPKKAPIFPKYRLIKDAPLKTHYRLFINKRVFWRILQGQTAKLSALRAGNDYFAPCTSGQPKIYL